MWWVRICNSVAECLPSLCKAVGSILVLQRLKFLIAVGNNYFSWFCTTTLRGKWKNKILFWFILVSLLLFVLFFRVFFSLFLRQDLTVLLWLAWSPVYRPGCPGAPRSAPQIPALKACTVMPGVLLSLVFMVLVIEPRALCMLGQCSY